MSERKREKELKKRIETQEMSQCRRCSKKQREKQNNNTRKRRRAIVDDSRQI